MKIILDDGTELTPDKVNIDVLNTTIDNMRGVCDNIERRCDLHQRMVEADRKALDKARKELDSWLEFRDMVERQQRLYNKFNNQNGEIDND